VPLFPKLPRRDFRYTPVSYDPQVQDLRDRLEGRLRLRRPAAGRGPQLAIVKWAVLLAIALGVYQYLHGDPLGRWLQEKVEVTGEDVVPPAAPGGRP
jgi:hypothetical protein